MDSADKVVESHPSKRSKLSKTTVALIERKRQCALLLRESRLQCDVSRTQPSSHYKDTIKSGPSLNVTTTNLDDLLNPVKCRECNIQCNASYLFTKFGETVCDSCKDKNKEQYRLISKTDAKKEFILKDCDFDIREPALKFVCASNPHNPKGGSMKLFLFGQVYERACEVHDGDDGIDEAVAQRAKNREVSAQRKLDKKMSELRKFSRPRQLKQTHVHEFGEESYNEEHDEYSHECLSCGYIETYEKL